MNPFETFLETYFDEADPKSFYRAVFPAGELEIQGSYKTGQYTAIALCISTKETRYKRRNRKQPDGSYAKEYLFNDDGTKKTEPKVYRYSMTDDLDLIDTLTGRDDLFCLMAPLSYAGKERSAKNARFMYGMAFDLDLIRVKPDGTPIGLLNLWNGHINAAGRLPKPTYIVSSGTGLHLYYLFENPVALFPNVVKQLQELKHELTEMIWNEGIVDIKDDRDRQYEGIFQGFRMPGTITKNGGRARAFETGEKVTIEYLNSFVRPQFQVTEFSYKSKLSKAAAKEKYPEWYEERIVQGKKGVLNPWAVNRNLYDWWKREILLKAQVGHRYYCLMILAVYAMKCSFYDPKKNPNPVTREELERDAFEIMEHFEEMTDRDDNHFDESDVLDALDAYDHGMLTFPRNSIEYRAGFSIPKNKRNGRKQSVHLQRARAVQNIDYPNGEWRKENGRHSKKEAVAAYRAKHPDATKAQCQRDTGLSRPTILKWWDISPESDDTPEYYQAKADQIIFTESEMTPELMAALAEKGVRRVNVVPDDMYEQAIFDQWLKSLTE